ncbi:MAG TPA: CU044_5270 family protein [Pseudonocardiaceae bacterium]|jgi:hypothetical protein|nr:CU044_5270 family protein [Pseudonocardiaceae bacterium]
MDDLHVIEALRPEAPLPTALELGAARGRLFAEFATPPAAENTPRSRGRLLWFAGAGVAAAAVVAAAVLVPGGGPSTTPSGPKVLNAAQVLTDAAAAARTSPDVVPRPDQFVYIKTNSGHETDQMWLSIDGTHDGLIVNGATRTLNPGCRDGRQAVAGGDNTAHGATQPCQPQPAYDPSLPTSPDALLRYLSNGRTFDPSQPSELNQVGKAIGELFTDSYVLPSKRAAVFEAAAKIPGLQVVPNAPGGAIGVAWPLDKGGSPTGNDSTELLFRSTTHAYLGITTVGEKGEQGSEYLLQVGIVDKPGDLPSS